MGLTVTVYDTDEHSNENRINFWLRQNNWTPQEAALLFLDIDPNTLHGDDWSHVEFLSGGNSQLREFNEDELEPLIDQETLEEYYPQTKLEEIGISNLKRQIQDYLKILDCKDNKSPEDWIEKATLKSVDIPWIGYAAKMQLVRLPENFLSALTEIFNEKSPTYSTALNWAIRAWFYAINNPNKQKPKLRMKAWLESNSLLSNNLIKECCKVANWDRKGGAPKTGQNN